MRHGKFIIIPSNASARICSSLLNLISLFFLHSLYIYVFGNVDVLHTEHLDYTNFNIGVGTAKKLLRNSKRLQKFWKIEKNLS